jgi:hypothetical protein
MNIKSKVAYVCRISSNSFEDCYQKLMYAITKRTNNLKDDYVIFDIHLDANRNEIAGVKIASEHALLQKYRDYYDEWIAKQQMNSCHQ